MVLVNAMTIYTNADEPRERESQLLIPTPAKATTCCLIDSTNYTDSLCVWFDINIPINIMLFGELVIASLNTSRGAFNSMLFNFYWCAWITCLAKLQVFQNDSSDATYLLWKPIWNCPLCRSYEALLSILIKSKIRQIPFVNENIRV